MSFIKRVNFFCSWTLSTRNAKSPACTRSSWRTPRARTRSWSTSTSWTCPPLPPLSTLTPSSRTTASCTGARPRTMAALRSRSILLRWADWFYICSRKRHYVMQWCPTPYALVSQYFYKQSYKVQRLKVSFLLKNVWQLDSL